MTSPLQSHTTKSRKKGYSLSAGQYFDIKIDYVDITEEEFNKRMTDYKNTLAEQFEESHRLENEIMRQLNSINFNDNAKGNNKMSNEIQFLLYSMPDSEGKVQVVIKNETIWCTQKAMAQLFGVGVPAISKHLKNILRKGIG